MPASARSSTASPEPDEFSRRAGKPMTAGKYDKNPISPSQSTFSFDNEGPAQAGVTFKPNTFDETQVSRKFDRVSPKDSAPVSTVKRDQQETNLSRRKSQFYSEVFAYREPNISTRNKIHQYSIITAEVKTNVIIKDEYALLADLSQHLSQRYHRPSSSIFITLSHSACLLLAGTFESAYILTLTALPSQIQPTTNKRNAALIQSFMSDAIGVSPSRGVIRFVGIAEEYLATNGTTVLGEIESLNKTSSEENGNENSRLGTIRSRSRRTAKPKELPLREVSPHANRGIPVTPPLKSPPMPAIPTEKSTMDKRAEKVQRMGRRRSFLAMFGK